uniref:ATP-dependent DNA helicase n=2 Tax=Rhodosorus marinus TaxID=101924 RepID=A0A7S2ZDA0_9RHOD|mmetsp:Transcript_15447/g.63032  ORF Transcript_15447/g.63032 Transcript_15447/m.63032 type:complete len:554 (+) Transcript_15447:566-2227(+)
MSHPVFVEQNGRKRGVFYSSEECEQQVRGNRSAKWSPYSSVEETKDRCAGASPRQDAQPLTLEPSHQHSVVSGELAGPAFPSDVKKESFFAVQPKLTSQGSLNGDGDFCSEANFILGMQLEESKAMPSRLSAELRPAGDSQPGIQLSEEQMVAIEHVRKGHNLFLTGCGGTGKSTVLREIIRQMTEILGEENVGVCAMTGVAAENVDGCTLHSLLGIGVPYERKDFRKMRNKSNSRRLQRLDLLIIDEVSMLSGEMLDYIDQELKEVRHSTEPFGGLQVVLSGDFYQLPPVRQSKVAKNAKAFNNLGYAFESNAWQSGALKVVDLAEVHRQRDSEFILALADLRRGEDTSRFQELLRQVRRQLPKPVDGIESTILYCHNISVDRHNLRKLQQIPSREVKFAAKDRIYPFGPKESEAKHEKALRAHSFWKNCRASSKLALKEGAQVMLLKNLSQTRGAYLINGSRGVVQGFADSGNPVVRFRNGQSKEVSTEEFTMKIPGIGACIRLQIPLALAWAVTVHKSQGMTLDRLKVNLDGTFDFGQAYGKLHWDFSSN